MKRAHLIAGFGMMTCAVATAGADLEGQTVTAQWIYPTFPQVLETHDVVVGDDIELTPEDIQSDTKFAIDLSGNTVTFLFNATSNWTETGFNGWRFLDTNDAIVEITGYELTETSAGIGNIEQIIPGFDANGFWADFAGMTVAGDGDYIVLTVLFGEGCPADINGDGVLNILDFVAFQAAWQAMEAIGDCDGNGAYNILDFVCYQGLFAKGCP